MPASSPEEFDVKALRFYFDHALHDSIVSEASVSSEYSPLLLLERSHIRAAFGFASANLENSYQALYQGFKELCLSSKGRWDALDRAFVFCVRPDVPDLDQFCSAIETDVYFCRKFVIPFVIPVDRALARLPFLPLSPLDGEHSLRPPSAQAFLKAKGVAAPLATAIVVPGQGVDRIVEGCIAGLFGEPALDEKRQAVGRALPERDSNAIVLESLAIENFRAYRTRHEFELGSAVTVLYGPNGFGKTSFFDALDFAATGSIGRLAKAEFVRTAKHLDSREDSSAVTLRLRLIRFRGRFSYAA